MADPQLSQLLQKRLALIGDDNDEASPATPNIPAPPPPMPQKIDPNPYVEVVDNFSVDDFIQNTLKKHDEENNNKMPSPNNDATAEEHRATSSHEEERPGSKNSALPPKTTIRDLLMKDYQTDATLTNAVVKNPIVTIEKRQKPAAPFSGPTLPSDDGSELERRLAAQRAKKPPTPIEPDNHVIYSSKPSPSAETSDHAEKQNPPPVPAFPPMKVAPPPVPKTPPPLVAAMSAACERNVTLPPPPQIPLPTIPTDLSNKTEETAEQKEPKSEAEHAAVVTAPSPPPPPKLPLPPVPIAKSEEDDVPTGPTEKSMDTVEVAPKEVSPEPKPSQPAVAIAADDTLATEVNEGDSLPAPPPPALLSSPSCSVPLSVHLPSESHSPSTALQASPQPLGDIYPVKTPIKEDVPQSSPSSSSALHSTLVPTRELIDMIRSEEKMKTAPPAPPKPSSRPQSPVVKKAPALSALGLPCDRQLSIEKPGPAVPSSPVVAKKTFSKMEEDGKELSDLLERRQKINEGESVPQQINKKLSLYAEFSEFTRKQIKFFTDTFKKFDEDADGFIDFEELKRMMEKLGEAQTHIALKEIIRKVDEDQDGKISLREFFLIFRLAADGQLGCSEVFTRLAESVDVTKEGVLGAAQFFQAKIEEQTKLSKFEEEIKAEQKEREAEEKEKKERREKFLQSRSLFK